MARILLLEDDPFLGKGLTIQLRAKGYEVVHETTVAQARLSEDTSPFDMFILDVNLPDGSGVDFCKELRLKGCKLPIVMLTARTDEDSVVSGFESGANDYVRKPFSNRELLVRIQALLQEPFVKEEKLRVGNVLIFVAKRKVMIDGEELELNRREFDIFHQLAKNPGAVFSREQLIQAMGSSDNILDRTIDSHFSHIRSKLKDRGIETVSIRSVYGVGYTLEVA